MMPPYTPGTMESQDRRRPLIPLDFERSGKIAVAPLSTTKARVAILRDGYVRANASAQCLV
jgi:hypothetical protein